MNADAGRQISLDDALIVDEIGIESGCYGIYRLRSLYQPIFRRREKTLKMVAVEGTAAPYIGGEEVPSEVFLTAVSDDDQDFIRRMGVAVSLRNHRNIDAEMLDLFLGLENTDPEMLADRIRLVAGELPGAELEPDCVVCALGEHAAAETALLSRVAETMRGYGLRIAVGDFGAGHWTDEAVDILKPEIVRIDGGWFRQVCRDATTIRLFDAVVSRLRERQAKVLVSGIESELQLGVALKVGADLLQGPHLAAPALAGMEMDHRPLSIAHKLGEAQRIVPLFG
ncbi:EAL domain-containing protein [Mesorhizobium sp. YM1C-6-2]|uniref:EAL domain-containing protein n=1 Tax=Mesorhizobium sp. YM1C-6-2 TaxID=1827501 RepID=UPI000EF17B11|nr:EAL domain-containing protein [Mesorhizobium sp. YM1C-6-2]RLP25438.1 EAL domain-containing protein [Mesorhizobium sp. YM1C-6-2]